MKKKAVLMLKSKFSGRAVIRSNRGELSKKDSSSFFDCIRSDEADMPERIREIGLRLSKDPAAAKAMLHRTGMYDKTGKLKEEFR